jgi:hypothetical protein
MRIGTDVSLKVCDEEGYTVIDFKVKELFPNGRKNPLDKDSYVNITQSCPLYLRDQMVTDSNPFGTKKLLDEEYSFNDLLEIYLEHKESIDSLCGIGQERGGWHLELESPDEYDLLNLADAIMAYMDIRTHY